MYPVVQETDEAIQNVIQFDKVLLQTSSTDIW